MKVRQLSIFIENESGRLAEITGLLGSAGIDIRSVSLADTSGFGILRLVVNDVDRAQQILHDEGFTVKQTEVVAVEMPDRPGGLAGILKVLAGAGINVEYMHAFSERVSPRAVVFFRFEDPDAAIPVLLAANIRVLSAQEVYSL